MAFSESFGRRAEMSEQQKAIDVSLSALEAKIDTGTIDNDREKETSELLRAHGLEKDHGMYFYIVQEGDTLRNIYNKLKKIIIDGVRPFEYMDDDFYNPSTRKEVNIIEDGKIVGQKKAARKRDKLGAWNIPTKQVRKGVKIPIPQPRESRSLEAINFVDTIGIAMNMLQQSQYSHLVSELAMYSHEHLARVIYTFADKESNHGANALFRWEGKPHNKFSYTWFHFLFPPKDNNHVFDFSLAAKNLGVTEGQACTDFSSAVAVFFAGLYEKTKGSVNNAQKNTPTGVYKTFGRDTFDGKKVYGKGYAYLLAEENIKYLAWLYNGISASGEKYAEDFVAMLNANAGISFTQDKKSVTVRPIIEETVSLEAAVTSLESTDDNDQTRGAFEELPPNSKGARLRKYPIEINSQLTAARVLEYFYEMTDKVGIDTSMKVKVVNHNNTIVYDLDTVFTSADKSVAYVYILEDKDYNEVEPRYIDLPHGYSLHTQVIAEDISEQAGAALDMELREKLDSGGYARIINDNVIWENVGAYSLQPGEELILLKAPDHTVGLDTRDTFKEISFVEGFEKKWYNPHDVPENTVSKRHFLTGYVYKVDTYRRQKEISVATLKKYFIDALGDEDVTLNNIELVDAFGFQIEDDGQTFVEDEYVYFGLKQ